MLAIIGGSGLSQLANLEVSHREVLRTPYGDPSSAITFGRIQKEPVAFLARHGYGHVIPPHAINYRANVWALAQRSVEAIVAVSAVGCIRSDIKPGDLVIPHQIIDYTWGRKNTYHDGFDSAVMHVDFTHPLDAGLRGRLIAASTAVGVTVGESAVYAVTQGPRLETAAEVDRLERDGVDVIGMTLMPEAVLARELSIPYVAINVVVNYAAGRGDSSDGIRFDAIETMLNEPMDRVRTIIESLVAYDTKAVG